MHEARAALARGLTKLRANGEAIGALLPMVVPEAKALLGLADPASALATLESAFAGEGRHDEAAVTRELRAIGGGLDDGAHAELRARRHTFDPSAPVPPVCRRVDSATSSRSVAITAAAPVASRLSRFAVCRVTAMGTAPIWLAICIAARPTPPDAAVIRTWSPEGSRKVELIAGPSTADS